MSTHLKFILWNCRGGIHNSRKQNFIKDLVRDHDIAFLGLLETKKELIDLFMVRRLFPHLDYDFSFVPSIGASGGLLWIWNTSVINVTSISTGDRWIYSDFMWEGSMQRYVLIYASTAAADHIIFWNENLVVGYTPSMIALKDFFNEAELIDLPLQGRSFTWHNSLSKGLSDHSPILFKVGNEVDWGPKTFCSFNAWWNHDLKSSIMDS
ncbi:uncharacterized protein LOC126687807 [Mercurialis annua]|uniref:uncharacterized protein LOC126687807 n=1 Tax=Mercurialis annua TaxID=3986 RepID=UPI00215ED342|nr:uncharacterized protein LOC126687807 [Mercurialis annua]